MVLLFLSIAIASLVLLKNDVFLLTDILTSFSFPRCYVLSLFQDPFLYTSDIVSVHWTSTIITVITSIFLPCSNSQDSPYICASLYRVLSTAGHVPWLGEIMFFFIHLSAKRFAGKKGHMVFDVDVNMYKMPVFFFLLYVAYPYTFFDFLMLHCFIETSFVVNLYFYNGHTGDTVAFCACRSE